MWSLIAAIVRGVLEWLGGFLEERHEQSKKPIDAADNPALRDRLGDRLRERLRPDGADRGGDGRDEGGA